MAQIDSQYIDIDDIVIDSECEGPGCLAQISSETDSDCAPAGEEQPFIQDDPRGRRYAQIDSECPDDK